MLEWDTTIEPERPRGARRTCAALFARTCCSLAIVLAAWLSPLPARAVSWQRPLAEAVHRSWSTADGLPGASILALAQTPDGYIWIGTPTALVRFDGQSFVTFDGATSPVFASGAWIMGLAVDGAGDLWAGTIGSGVIRYHRGELTAFTTKNGLASDYIKSLAVGPDQTVWVGSTKGVDAIRGGAVVDFPGRARLAGKEVSALCPDVDGGLWLAVPNVRLWWIFGDAFRAFDAASGLTSKGAYKVVRDKQGTLWVASGGGIFRQDGERFVPLDGVLSDNHSILSLYVDKSDALWFGPAESGLRVAHHGHLPQPGQSLASALDRVRVETMLEDREGTLWLGTESDGLHALRDGTFLVISPLEKPLMVFSALETRDGSLWIGSASGAIRWRNGDVSIYGEKEGVAGGSVYAIHEDEQGGLWLGTSQTLVQWTGDRFAEIPEVTKEGGSHLVVDVTGKHDSLWVAVQGTGLLHLEEGKTRLYTQQDGLPSVDLTALHLTPDGTLWIGTLADVARCVNGRIEPFQPASGARSPAAVYTFFEDGPGALWLGSLGGIGRYQGGTLTMFPRLPGVPLGALLVGADTDRNLWVGVGTGAGIYRVPIRDLERSLEMPGAVARVRSFDESDGLKNREANAGHGPIRLHDGRMAFPTVNGLAIVNPAYEVRNDVEPSVVIQRVEADGTELRAGDLATLRAGTRHLRIDYAALTYVAPQRVRYRYKLEGYDHAWVEAGADRSARYTNLAPGAYRFVVVAENGDGIWTRSGAQVSLRQNAFFYQTAWFYLASAAIFAAAAVGSYRYRIGKVRAVAAMLETRVVERTFALNQALEELRDKDAHLRADLMQARTFQQALLPKLPRRGRLSFAALYEPAELVGGDIYDVAELRPGLYRIFLADTTGHGVQASLRTIVIKKEYDRLKYREPSPAALLTALNAALFTGSEGNVRCTACCIDIHTSEEGRAKVVYANAAHPEVLHLGKTRRSLYAPGMYMGFVAGAAYVDLETELFPGDLLVVYSDGATEASASDGRLFGLDGLAAALESALTRGDAPDSALGAAHRALVEFSPSGAGPADDVTMVAIRFEREGATDFETHSLAERPA